MLTVTICPAHTEHRPLDRGVYPRLCNSLKYNRECDKIFTADESRTAPSQFLSLFA